MSKKRKNQIYKKIYIYIETNIEIESNMNDQN